jgi:hypothetical protein
MLASLVSVAVYCDVHTFQAWVAFPQRPKHVLLPPVVKTSQSWVVGGLAVGSTVKTSFQFSNVSGYWMTSTTLAAASLAAVSSGADGIEAEIVEDTAAVALLKKPLTLSSIGTCCASATASAGRARIMPDETRIVPCVCGGRGRGRGRERVVVRVGKPLGGGVGGRGLDCGWSDGTGSN